MAYFAKAHHAVPHAHPPTALTLQPPSANFQPPSVTLQPPKKIVAPLAKKNNNCERPYGTPVLSNLKIHK